jgi:hypothetical protein
MNSIYSANENHSPDIDKTKISDITRVTFKNLKKKRMVKDDLASQKAYDDFITNGSAIQQEVVKIKSKKIVKSGPKNNNIDKQKYQRPKQFNFTIIPMSSRKQNFFRFSQGSINNMIRNLNQTEIRKRNKIVLQEKDIFDYQRICKRMNYKVNDCQIGSFTTDGSSCCLIVQIVKKPINEIRCYEESSLAIGNVCGIDPGIDDFLTIVSTNEALPELPKKNDNNEKILQTYSSICLKDKKLNVGSENEKKKKFEIKQITTASYYHYLNAKNFALANQLYNNNYNDGNFSIQEYFSKIPKRKTVNLESIKEYIR